MTKTRVTAEEQMLLRIDAGDTAPLDEEAERAIIQALTDEVSDCAAVVACDYDLGVFTNAVVRQLADLRSRLPLFVVDAHHLARWRSLRPDLTVPNADEAVAVLGLTLPDDARRRLTTLEQRRDALAERTGSRLVVVTLDRDGAVLFAPGRPSYRTWARPVRNDRAAGAGDTFCAALTLATCAGLPAAAAVEFAQAAADVAVHSQGTAICSAEQLRAQIAGHQDSMLDAAGLDGAVSRYRAVGARIVFTNGCFDVVHRGHVTYLNEAKRLGDVLVVGLNSDDSVARLKGLGRPVNCAADRAAVLTALSCVDHVVVFEEDTPADILRRVRPDVYVKGGDYTPEMLPEADVVRGYGGDLVILDYVPDHSTTAVLDRIRSTVG